MAERFVGFPARGCVVEFMQGNRPLQAWVLEEQAGRLRLYTINQRETKLQADRLLPWSGPRYGEELSRAEMQNKLELHRRKREEIAGGLELEALWNLTREEEVQEEVLWFAELLWPEPDIDQLAALGQAMLARKLYFKFSPPYFEVRSLAQVEQKLEQQAREERLNGIVRDGTEFFRKVYASLHKQAPLTEADFPPPERAGELRALLLKHIEDPDAQDQDPLWKNIAKNIGAKNGAEDPCLPLELACGWGILPEHHNYLLDRLGYEAGEDWDAPYAEDRARLSAEVEKILPGIPEREEPFFSIDPASTKDRDDAVCLRPDPGGCVVSVAIACPSLAWPFDSALDKAVAGRASSLYLPEGDLFMLPRGICCDLFSLEENKDRPALITDIFLDQDLNIAEVRPALSRVRLENNLSLEESEALLSGLGKGEEDPPRFPADGESQPRLAGRLSAAHSLALALRRKRLANGAIVTEREDPEISLLRDEEGELRVRLSPAPSYERSHTLVGEAMILCNSALALWGKAHDIPLIYRTQAAGLSREHSGVWTSPHEINHALKGLPPARLSVEPKPHAGVGAALYSSFTSPLRRYLDLVNQAQVLAYLLHGQPRLKREEMESLLPQLALRLKAAGQAQRFRLRYWKLLYLQQQEQKHKGRLHYWEGTIVDENSNNAHVLLHLPELTLSGDRSLFGERALPGSRVEVRVGKINPLRNEIQIMEVLEN
ncbi:MAG: RNB domain-containing ribonuclease [Deltaproteobacteria bacterium]|jgi:exoribonuclease-2|nr:RNB domain-containing ribonuclease [Deltaproteobacteria bacterium]